MVLVIILTVRSEALEKFREFERRAAVVMAKHGGVIERTVVVPPAGAERLMKEVHIVTFPSQQALLAYQNDPALREVAYLRHESVVHTEILAGEEGPTYHTSQEEIP